MPLVHLVTLMRGQGLVSVLLRAPRLLEAPSRAQSLEVGDGPLPAPRVFNHYGREHTHDHLGQELHEILPRAEDAAAHLVCA